MNDITERSDEYNALRQAMDDEDELMKKIEEVMEKTPNKEEAERIINEKYVPLIKKKMTETRRALNEFKKAEKSELAEIDKEIDRLIGDTEEEE